MLTYWIGQFGYFCKKEAGLGDSYRMDCIKINIDFVSTGYSKFLVGSVVERVVGVRGLVYSDVLIPYVECIVRLVG